MMDTTAVWARTSDGQYHKSVCLVVDADDDPEPIHEIPDGIEFPKCCRHL